MDVVGIKPFSKIITITKSDQAADANGVQGNFKGPNGLGPFGSSISDAIYVGGAGVVVIVFPDGDTFSATCIAGQTLPVRAVRVNSASTTATLMGACYY